jgi:ferrous iron transport protein B
VKVAVAGNPNVGKTSLFNVLTGARHRVGNYPGVTVERREGALASRWRGVAKRDVVLIDLPGTYSLTALSEDEAVAFRTLAGVDDAQPDVVLLVLDASNLARNLYLALQVRELGVPVVVALNMIDVAREAGLSVDADRLSDELGVPVVGTIGRTGEGIEALVEAIGSVATEREAVRIDPSDEDEALRDVLGTLGDELEPTRARWLLVSAAAERLDFAGATDPERRLLAAIGNERIGQAAQELVCARYRWVDRVLGRLGHADAVRDAAPVMTASDRVDRVLTHKLSGLAIFVAVMALVFVSIFWFAEPVMGLIEGAVAWSSTLVSDVLGPGLLTDLITEGVIAGAGNVLVFIPQIALLFLFIGLLEDSGYLARAAFLLDRVMARLGLHGRAFIPLLSGYACAIPAILGTRTISSWRDRVVTILMIPYMTCSARLPIYTLIIAALFVSRPEDAWVTPAIDRGLVLLGMYALSTVSALAMGFLYKRTILRSPTPPLVLELPPYRLPRLGNTVRLVFDRTADFVKNAGTVILAFTVVLWAALSFPREDTGAGGGGPTQIERSYGGRAAKTIEPVLEPIGQDWRVGIGIIGSFAAREVLVSTLGLAYGMEASDEDPVPLGEAMRNDVDPETGEPVHTPLSGLALMVFFVYACQCMSTVAVVRRETRSWKWPVFMFVSMTAIAYVAALLVFQGGHVLGFD